MHECHGTSRAPISSGHDHFPAIPRWWSTPTCTPRSCRPTRCSGCGSSCCVGPGRGRRPPLRHRWSSSTGQPPLSPPPRRPSRTVGLQVNWKEPTRNRRQSSERNISTRAVCNKLADVRVSLLNAIQNSAWKKRLFKGCSVKKELEKGSILFLHILLLILIPLLWVGIDLITKRDDFRMFLTFYSSFITSLCRTALTPALMSSNHFSTLSLLSLKWYQMCLKVSLWKQYLMYSSTVAVLIASAKSLLSEIPVS